MQLTRMIQMTVDRAEGGCGSTRTIVGSLAVGARTVA